MKQKTQSRAESRRTPTKTEPDKWAGFGNFNLLQWVNMTIIWAVRSKAKEIRYERGRDGLTVQYRRDSKVLETRGPFKRYQDKAIPQLRMMAKIDLAKKGSRLTGKYQAMVDNDLWDFGITWTRTKQGERLVARLSGPRPWRETKPARARRWAFAALLRGIAIGASEARFERGKDGMTVRFRKGNRLFDPFGGPFGPEYEMVIPWLKKKAKIDAAKQARRLVGRFEGLVDDRPWNFLVTSTARKTGELLVVRFSPAQTGKKAK